MTDKQKETIYVDVDDEITAIIDKVRSSKKGIVALVLPKRAAVLKSIVNMKLLKRTADEADKHVVLITSETGLMPLAGAVGMYVAKTLQSKPVVPPAPEQPDVKAVSVDEDEEPDIDGDKPIGELAGMAVVGATVANIADEDDVIEVDNEEPESVEAAKKATKTANKPKKGKDKKLKVPNFNKFRTWLFIGIGLLILIIILGITGNRVLPKATISLKTETSDITKDISFTASTTAQTADLENGIIPATNKEIRKTENEKVPATGQKNVGNKANGTVSLKNCTKTDGEVNIPVGTSVFTNNFNYVTNEAVSLPASSFSGGGNCTTATEDVDVTAQNPGDQYNVAAGRTFGVSGYSGVNGTNSAGFGGGTNKIVKVVSQEDIDSAKTKVTERTANTAKQELQQQLSSEGYYALNESFTTGAVNATSSPNVGEEASEVTASVTATYSMMGVKEADLNQLINQQVSKDIDTSKQDITNNGLDKATIKIGTKTGNGNTTVNIQVTATAGPKLDQTAIKEQIKGKKKGETTNILQSYPGVKDVTVNFSPFWVSRTPKNVNKITINIESIKTDGQN